MIKDTCTGDTCTVGGIYICTKSTCIIGYHTRNAWIGGVCIGNISIIYTCIKDAGIKEIYIGATYIKTAYIIDTSTCADSTYIWV